MKATYATKRLLAKSESERQLLDELRNLFGEGTFVADSCGWFSVTFENLTEAQVRALAVTLKGVK